MKSLIFLFLILTSISNIKGDYSISPFLNFLQENGLYDFLASIKHYFGDDICIDICKELTKTYDCYTLVKIYFPSNSRGIVENGEAEKIMDEYEPNLRTAGYKSFEIKRMRDILMRAG